MATVTDPNKVIVDLLSNNWNSANTDGNTPVISKIYEQPKNEINFDFNNDYILIYSPSSESTEIGIGNNTAENVFDSVTIDIRSYGDFNALGGLSDDEHVLKVKTELMRILKTNKIGTNITPYSNLSSTAQYVELNDRTRGIFRYTQTVILTQYCRDFS